MEKFTEWLKNLDASSKSQFSDLIKVIEAGDLDDVDKNADRENVLSAIKKLELENQKSVVNQFSVAWDEWFDDSDGITIKTDNLRLNIIGKWVSDNSSNILGTILILPFAVIIVHAFISGDSILNRLNSIETARGAITFLFALGTIILALMLVGSALFAPVKNEKEFAQRKERFNQGKEILSILIGILGTVVGFYFGAQNVSVTTDTKPTISAPEVEVTKPAPSPGDKVSMGTRISGGEPPYSYTLTFDNSFGLEPIKGMSSDGFITESFLIPGDLKRDKNYRINIKTIDAQDHNIELAYQLEID